MNDIARLIGLATAVLVLSSCRDTSGPQAVDGTFTAIWAEKEWKAVPAAYLVVNKLHIGGSKMNSTGQIPVEFITVEIDNPAVGTFDVGAGRARFAELIGGDVVGAVYQTTQQSGGSLTITRYDGPGGIVEGFMTFEAELIEGTGTYGPKNRLKDGHFSARVARPLD